MLFNSIDFAIFLPIVFFFYWFVTNKNLKLQNLLIVAASYLFYGWWDWRFLSLIIFSSIVDYFVGIALSKEQKQFKRKVFLLLSICVNLGFLGFFKYFNFFAESFTEAFTLFGKEFESTRLNIVLPVGISFYTFQTLSYSIDVYKGKLKPTHDFISFFAFVSFFPQLVAGPIERAKSLLPQFYSKRTFDYSKAADGVRQALWGLFKKIVIADNCAYFVNDIFSNYQEYGSITLLLGVLYFSFQIYCDFSGYSDIAIGTSRLFGFNLMQNFAFPYFSRDIAEFWRRWHISLSTWFRDYLYIPLGGSRGGTWMKVRNTFVIFIVSGLWHGANWTFVFWGFLNALYFLPLLLMKKNRINTDIIAEGKSVPGLIELFKVLVTFTLTMFAWILFRAESIGHAINYIVSIFSPSNFGVETLGMKKTIPAIIVLVIVEWFQRDKQHGLYLNNKSTFARWGLYFLIVMMILLGGNFGYNEFIYFQF